MAISPTIIFIILSVLIALSLAWQFWMWRKWKTIFRSGAMPSLEKVIEAQVAKTKKIEGEMRRQLEEILKIKEDHLSAFQKVRSMRFNSIDETGANQSFALVALDGRHNGFMLTSLYLGNTPRLFMKTITQGVCAQKLSPEEEQVLHETLTQ